MRTRRPASREAGIACQGRDIDGFLAFSDGTIMDIGLHQSLQQAVDHGLEAYITSCRARIPGFIDRHFSVRGALALHRKTFGRDWSHPVNLVWGVPVALGHGAADLLAKAGAHRTAQWLHRIPRGMSTALHQELHWLLYTELLELPYVQEGRASPRCAAGAHPRRTADCCAVRRICDATAPRRGSARRPSSPGTASGGVWQNPRRRLGIGRQPAHAGCRVRTAEQGHPGALSAGTAAATAIAQHLAIANCWLGSTVGAWYYAVFPVRPRRGWRPPPAPCSPPSVW